MRSILLWPLCAALCSADRLTAQVPHQGNGVGAAFLASSPAVIGGALDLTFGSANIPNGLAAFCSSDGFGPISFPNLGQVWLDYTSAEFFYQFFTLDGQGEATASLPIPNQPSFVGLTPLFAACVAFEPSNGISISKTVRIDHDNQAAFRPVGSLAQARSLHTATALAASDRDNETRVLIAGGGGGTLFQPTATDSTEIYVPLTKSFVTGPTMSVERTLHQAVRLADGRVLLCGGADTAGNVTTSCEIFDPATNSIAPTGSLNSPRAGHAATLLANGLVLVTGGLADYVNPTVNLLAVLNTAQDTGELFDPATGVWTALTATMTSARSGHSQTVLPDGTLLLVGGIFGAATSPVLNVPVPAYTGSCEVYDPVANTFTSTGALVFGRAFHGASVLANGDVLVTGGTVSNITFGIVNATDSCELWNGNTWSAAAALPQGLTNHTQVAAANGDAQILGGLTGAFPAFAAVDTTGAHNGSSYTASTLLGTNPGFPANAATALAAMTATRLGDGSWLLVGGSDGNLPVATTLIFVE